MIFVTVGTHEQPFDRLVSYMDRWAEKHDEEVVIQTGYSTVEPQHCRWERLFPYARMLDYTKKARIVITHGGPSSFIMPLQVGKIPLVVPRQKRFDEHVNDHQLEFCRSVAQRKGNILVVEDIEELGEMIENYKERTAAMTGGLASNNARFCEDFEKLVREML